MNKTDYSIYINQIKSVVSCRQFLESNGIKVKHGFAVCPLHGDNDASLKVYDNGRGWCCYGCHKGGDIINLAREYYGTGFNDTVRRLNEEFKIGLDLDAKISKKDDFLWKARKTREKYERIEKERALASAEKSYMDWLEVYLKAEDLIVDMEPERNDGLSEFFGHLLNIRNTAKIRAHESYWEWVAYG